MTSESARLKQRVAIVTGAARGIGAAIAWRLAGDGMRVAVADVDLSAAEAQAERMRSAGRDAFATLVDVAEPTSVRRMTDEVASWGGRLDVLVNNAGIAGLSAPTVEYPEAEWRRVLSIDLDGVFYCCKVVLPHFLRDGYGRIVNIASIAGKEGNPNMAAYSAAKAGIIGLTKALGKELATTGILVNCVTPAVVQTDILDQLTENTVRYMVSKIPMGRTGRPEEIAAMVSWLSSEECSFSTGAVFDVSGGRATY